MASFGCASRLRRGRHGTLTRPGALELHFASAVPAGAPLTVKSIRWLLPSET